MRTNGRQPCHLEPLGLARSRHQDSILSAARGALGRFQRSPRGARVAASRRELRMQLFLDSAITDEIKHALEVWDVDGFTTNPRHVQASGKPLRRVLDEIAKLVAGTDKPVSVEVNPRLSDWRQIVEEALSMAAMSPNFVVKVGASESGFRAVRELTGRGVRTNVTLVFSATQAWHAARSGATYVSPFLGWKEAHGDESRTLLPEIMTIL